MTTAAPSDRYAIERAFIGFDSDELVLLLVPLGRRGEPVSASAPVAAGIAPGQVCTRAELRVWAAALSSPSGRAGDLDPVPVWVLPTGAGAREVEHQRAKTREMGPQVGSHCDLTLLDVVEVDSRDLPRGIHGA